MGFLRGLRSILISGVFAAACSVGGIRGIVDRVTYESPSETTCQDFEVGANSKWVSLCGCEAMIVDAEYRETTKLKLITSIRVPVRALGSDGPPKFILKTSNKNLLSVNRPLESTIAEENVMTRPTKPLDSAAIERLADDLSNTDIHWDGTLIGLTPMVVSDSARELLALGKVVIPRLVIALEDESKFVVAHVVLTLVSGVEYHTMPWNGLEVGLLPDGQVKVDAAQRFELARRWQKWQQSTPRPRSLPE